MIIVLMTITNDISNLGTILGPRGPLTFGWDPIFQPDGFQQTFSEMPKETKNTISHRGRSAAKLKEFLLAQLK